MPWCYPCDKYFNTQNGYSMHMEHNTAHKDLDWECEVCSRCFRTEQARHQHYSASHPYCASCRRVFMNQNNLMQHMHSRIHAGADMQCPFCKRSFATASGVTIHLESGSCSSGLNRHKINDMVRRLDRNNVITRPMITMPGYDRVETIATSRAWNGSGFECYLCTKQFNSLHSLNNHLKSPAHEQKIYRCPNRQCGREYKLLSGLVQHVESESCGLMRFSQVQRQARNGIQNMVGKMITG